MNRLDDELRNAFKREQPSAEFTARLLERIARQPMARPRWWQRLAMLLEPPKLRWVAIGVTASILLAVGAAEYSKLHLASVDESTIVAKVPPSVGAENATIKPDNDNQGHDVATPKQKPERNIRRSVASSSAHRLEFARYQKERELQAEGEAAKQKLMLALSIASSALNDAERAIRDEGVTP
jgi:hypothetical protein